MVLVAAFQHVGPVAPIDFDPLGPYGAKAVRERDQLSERRRIQVGGRDLCGLEAKPANLLATDATGPDGHAAFAR